MAAASTRALTGSIVDFGALCADLPIGQIEPHLFRVAAGRITVAAAARGLEHDPVPGAQRSYDLGGHRLLASLGTMDDGAGHCPVTPPGAALRGDEVALAAVREAHLAVQYLVFPDDAEAAPLRTGAAGITVQRHAMHADRRIELECLGRQVHAVRGVGLDDVDAVFGRTGAGAAGDQLACDVARAVGPCATECQHQQLPAAV